MKKGAYQLPHNLPCLGNPAEERCAASWASNTIVKHLEHWNFAAETSSWISDNIDSITSQGVRWVYSKCAPFPVGNREHLGAFVEVKGGGCEEGTIYYIDTCGVSHVLERANKCGGCDKEQPSVCHWAYVDKVPEEDVDSENLCRFVQVTEAGLSSNNIYFVDGAGVPHLVEYGQRGGDWVNNKLLDIDPDDRYTCNLGDFFQERDTDDIYFVDNTGDLHLITPTTKINFSSNTAVWTSNNLAKYPLVQWLKRRTPPGSKDNADEEKGNFIEIERGDEKGNVYYVEMDGEGHLVSRVHKWRQEVRPPVPGASYTANDFIVVTGTANERSNIYWVDEEGRPRLISRPADWDWGSNTASLSYDKAVWSSNGVPTWVFGGPTPMKDKNLAPLGKFNQLDDERVYFIDIDGTARLLDDPLKLAWCSNNFSNLPTSEWIVVDEGEKPDDRPGAINKKYLGRFVEIGTGLREGDRYYVDIKGNARLIEEPMKLKWSSNTTDWCSNELSRRPKVEWVMSTIVPDENFKNNDNLGQFVEISSGIYAGDRYYIDLNGKARLIESPSNVEAIRQRGLWTSNALSNYALSNGQSNWNWASNQAQETKVYLDKWSCNWTWGSNAASWSSNTSRWASNTAYWASNNIPEWLDVPNWEEECCPDDEKYLGKFINDPVTENRYYKDYTGKEYIIEDTAALRWTCNTAVYGCNTAVYGCNTAVWGCNTAVWGCNTAVWASNNIPEWETVNVTENIKYTLSKDYKGKFVQDGNGDRWYVDYKGDARVIEEPGKIDWASNNIPEWCNVNLASLTTENIKDGHKGKFIQTTDGNRWYVDYTGDFRIIEDQAKINWASNNIPEWRDVDFTTNVKTQLSNDITQRSKFVEDGLENRWYVDYKGDARLIEDTSKINWASNTADTALDKAFWSCNTAIFASNNIPEWCNLPTKPASFAGLQSKFLNVASPEQRWYVDHKATGLVIEDTEKIEWASNTADTALDKAIWSCNTSIYASNSIPYISPTNVTAANTALRNTFQHNADGSKVWYVDGSGDSYLIHEETPDVPDDYWIEPNKNYTYTMCNVGIKTATDPASFPSPTSLTTTPKNTVLAVGGDTVIQGRLHIYNNDYNGIFVYNQDPRTDDSGKGTAAEVCCWRPTPSPNLGIDDTNSHTFGVDDSGPATGRRFAFLRYNGKDYLTCDPENRVSVGLDPQNGGGPYQRFTALNVMGKISAKETTVDSLSDVRIKEDIELADIQMCYHTIKNLALKYFRLKGDYFGKTEDRHQLGWIAQEVEKVFPKSVTKHKAYGFDDLRLLNVSQLYATMYGALQYTMGNLEAAQELVDSQQARITTLETKLAAAETKIAVLENFMQTMMASLAQRV